MQTGILLASEKKLMIEGLVTLFSSQPELVVKGIEVDIFQILQKSKRCKPDVIIASITFLRKIDEFDLTNLCLSYKVIGLSDKKELGTLKSILKAGVLGIVLIEDGITCLVKAIEQVKKGESFYSAEVIQNIISAYLKLGIEINGELKPVLTKRQHEILYLLAKGKKSQEIADELCISIHTVETHRKNMVRKMNVKNSVEMVQRAISSGMI